MKAIELLGAPQSVYVRTTRLALEEKGVPYTLIPTMPHVPEVTAINPFGRIPVARHGACELFESMAIIVYADRTFPGPRLIPEDPVRAARVIQWACAVSTSVFPSLAGYMQANSFPKTDDGRPDPEVIAGFLPVVQKQIGVLDRAVESTGHLAGDSFTVADMYLMPILAYLCTFPDSTEALARAAHLRSYYETHAQRASFQATTPPPVAELRSSPRQTH